MSVDPIRGVAQSRLTFRRDNVFLTELRRRVDDYFHSSGRRRRDCPAMYLKTAIILAVFGGFYLLLVFMAGAWWQALPLATGLGLAIAAIGFNIEHDGSHHSYSNHAWINRLAAMTMDLIGASSYVWHWKHVVIHHTYVNITGHDADIDIAVFGRLTPHQKRFRFHRWQHFYLWPLYGLNVIKWHLYDDFRDVILGRIALTRMPRPKRWELIGFVAGKALFLTLAFGLPLLVHRLWIVLLFYALTVGLAGVVVSVVFQLAHCVEEAQFPLPQKNAGSMENAWAVHQVETTVDFARRSRVESWLLGGLNFQIEHHLFPRVCHVNYPAISSLVEQTCRDFGVSYVEHTSLRAGLSSHFRWLRRMGAQTAGGAHLIVAPEHGPAE
ncbi:MAG TPA: acyl-CoA desaturase [Pyrinomonadaceae bacterium]|nr:acyl-CoA desaturase [Pyrinomonadaceae bacterium]